MRLPNHGVVLTGGTGFVGSYLAAELIQRGTFVAFLARSTSGASARQRVEQVMRWHGRTEPDSYAVFDGDVTTPRFGLGDDEYRQLCRLDGEIWHCASETSFSQAKRELLEHVNIGGTHNVLAFASKGGARRVNYIGTSYSVGRVSGVVPEKLQAQNDFHNPYEETKHTAERLLLDRMDEAGIPSVIFRPSIIIGESGSGRTLAFKGMYYPLKLLNYFRTLFLADLEHNAGQNARRVGAGLDGDGKLNIPLRLVTGGGGGNAINLVPIDYVVESCVRIHAEAEPGQIYHIANERPVTIGEFTGFIEDVMGLRGVRVVDGREFAERPESELEQRFRTLMKVYLPYLSDEREFATDNARAVLRPHGLTCPAVDQSILERCLEYAVSVNWATPWAKQPSRPAAQAVAA